MERDRSRSPLNFPSDKFGTAGKALSNDNNLPPRSSAVTSASSDPHYNLFPIDASLPDELKKLCKLTKCELCNLQISLNKTAAADHYSGKPHQKKINLWMVTQRRGGEVSLYCKYCDKNFCSPLVAHSHYIGKKHQQVIKNGLKNCQVNPDTGTTERSETAKEDKTGRFGIGLAFAGTTRPKEGLHKFICEMCNVHSPSQSELEKHLAGAKHRKKCNENIPSEAAAPNNCSSPKDNLLDTVRKISERPLGDADLSIFRTPSGHYYCPLCNITLNSAHQYLEHSNSKRHKNAKSSSGNKIVAK